MSSRSWRGAQLCQPSFNKRNGAGWGNTFVSFHAFLHCFPGGFEFLGLFCPVNPWGSSLFLAAVSAWFCISGRRGQLEEPVRRDRNSDRARRKDGVCLSKGPRLTPVPLPFPGLRAAHLLPSRLSLWQRQVYPPLLGVRRGQRLWGWLGRAGLPWVLGGAGWLPPARREKAFQSENEAPLFHHWG